MKAAVYCGTRNLYEKMVPAYQSLLAHSDVDKIYLVIEDDVFPYTLPDEVKIINVVNQQWFPKNGPNYNSSWSYMNLIRMALPKILTDIDKVLYLDTDTIVNENINELWDIPIDDYYFAACIEPLKTNTIAYRYYQFGVLMINLKKLRDDKKVDEIINALNNTKYTYVLQDCVNKICHNNFYELPPDYNVTKYTHYAAARHRKIIHFAANKNYYGYFPIVQKYKKINYIRNIQDKYDLEIFIFNGNNLNNTLNSIPKNIKVTNINKDFNVKDIKSPYCMFIDSGDIFISNYTLNTIINNIKNDTMPYVYSYHWINNKEVEVNGVKGYKGYVFKTELFQLYDVNLNNWSTAIDSLHRKDPTSYQQSFPIIIYKAAKE